VPPVITLKKTKEPRNLEMCLWCVALSLITETLFVTVQFLDGKYEKLDKTLLTPRTKITCESEHILA
jgi:hypothetical protein